MARVAVLLVVGLLKIDVEAVREVAALLGKARELDAEETVWRDGLPASKRGLELPIDITPRPGALSHHDERNGRVLQVQLPNALHHVIGIVAVDNFLGHLLTKATGDKSVPIMVERPDEFVNLVLVIVMIGDETSVPDLSHL